MVEYTRDNDAKQRKEKKVDCKTQTNETQTTTTLYKTTNFIQTNQLVFIHSHSHSHSHCPIDFIPILRIDAH